MGLFTPTTEGLNKNKLITPAVWYPVEVISVKDGTSKEDGSAYTKVDFKILAGEFEGITLNTAFSEKWHEGVVPFVAACMGRVHDKAFEKEVANQAIEVSDKNFKGKRLEVYVERSEYKNKKNNKTYPQNNISAFRPAAGKAV